MFKKPSSARATLSAALLLALTSEHTSAQSTWTGATDTDWTVGTNWSAGVPGAGSDVVFGTPVPGTGSIIALGAGSLANSLWIQDNYSFNSNDLSLTSGGVRVNLGQELILNSQLNGTAGLTLLGGGVLRLTNNLNNYTGTTSIGGGMVVITNPLQLGASSNAINVTAGNDVPSNTSTIGITGGGLMLNGSGGAINFSRNLNLEGLGHFGNRSGALVSVGNNTLSGTVATAFSTQTPTTNRQTRLLQSNGTLTLSGNFDVGSATSGAQLTTLGGVNTAGAGGSYNLTGTLTGLGYIEKSGAGTLFWNPNDASTFGGRLRISASATGGGQSTVRVTSNLDGLGNPIFGTANAGGNAMPIDLNGGVLEIRSDIGLNFARNVYLRADSTQFVGPAPGGIGINQTATFAAYHKSVNTTHTFNSRNGYGMTFTGNWTQNSDNNNNTVTNNMGGTLTFGGTAWNNTDSGARTLTIGGNGNTVITGNIAATGGTKNLTKTGTGLLTLNGTGASLNGSVNINGGSIAIRDFRSVNNNTATINIGTGSTAGALVIGSSAAVGSAANLTTSKVINMTGSTGGATIFANQTGTNPVLLNGAFTVNGAGSTVNGAKTLTLGGSNTANNTIAQGIPNSANGGVTSLLKVGSGTWVLAGANTYTGTTTITNGTLKLQANAATSTVLPAASSVIFNANNTFAGGTLEFVGQASTTNVQTIGTLTPTLGMGTVRLTPGSGGTASLVITTLGTVAATSGLNFVGADFVNNTITLNGTNGLLNRAIYFNGANFAYRDTNKLRAPVYGTDAGFVTSASALTAAANNEVTGSFATPGVLSINTLKLTGSPTLTFGGALTLSGGGLLATGGSSLIDGSDLALGTQALIVRVNQASDSLNIASQITGSGGLTKNGAGTLVLSGPSSATGGLVLNEGTIRLADSGNVGAASRALTMRQGTVFDLNGISPNELGAFNNNGTVTNTSASPVTLTIGSADGTGTSFGIINEVSGRINVVKTGSGAQSWLGNSTYTGSTTISGSGASNTGLVTVDVLADIGQPSGIGRGDATNAATNAASLVFGGTSAGLVYAGNIRDNSLIYGSQSASTNRLFTLAGTDAILSSTAGNNNAIIWSNTGAIAHATAAARTLSLRGTSAGDNTFNPQLTDSGVGSNVTSLSKFDAGQWNLGNSNNNYSGATTVTNGILGLNNTGALPAGSPLVLAPASATSAAVFQMSGTLDRNLNALPTAGTGGVNFAGTVASTTGGVGFAAHTTPLLVALGGAGTPTPLSWGNGGFVGTTVNQNLVLSSTTALSLVDFRNAIDLNAGSAATLTVGTTASSNVVTTADTSTLRIGQRITGSNIPANAVISSITNGTTFVISANATSTESISAGLLPAQRTVNVLDNGNTGADYAILSGVLSGTTGDFRKIGAGALVLSGANTYTGQTLVEAGTLQVYSLGKSDPLSSVTSSVGAAAVPMTDANAIVLGNGGTTGGILQYTGPGETSDRKIRLNTTTGSNQIHADGTGALILTNVANDFATPTGNKTLFLRGTSVFTNMVTSQLTNDSGAPTAGTLGITVDGSTAWVLTNPLNSYTGTTTAGGGLLGIGADTALGGSTLANTNGNVFAYGGDRAIANAVTLGNNATNGWQGDYSLTFSSAANFGAGANNIITNNSIVNGKALTFAGMTANGLTANRSWTLNGPGHTIVNGDFTTSTTFGVPITINDGMLSLGGTGASNFNQNAANIDIDRGTLRFIANNVVPSAAGAGGIVFSPESTTADTARLELNGTNQTFNAFTTTGAGIGIIDNNSASSADLRFGANGANVDFGSGGGTYSILNTGTGALSLIHTGNAAGSIAPGVTLAHKGLTASEGGGVFNISSAVTATTGLSVTNASTLGLLGGITNQNLITSINVAGGSTLSLLDGVGTVFSNLSTLNLGVGGTGTVTLNLNVGTGATDTLQLLSGTAGLGNTITFNMTDAGLADNTTYTLLNLPGGGINAFGLANMIQGATPGGFDSMTWDVTDNFVRITTGNLLIGDLFWRGLTNATWNGAANNWSTDKAGATPASSIPGAGSNVIFAYDGVGAAALTTTLEQNFKVNSLRFDAGVTTPASVTINAGALASARVEVAPQLSADGIQITAGGPAAVAINTPVRLGANQTWSVADATSVLTIGELQGEADVTLSGSGRVVLSAAANTNLNGNDTMDVTINSGTLETQNVNALGSFTTGNLANVALNGGAFYYNNATTGTVSNPITLNGGTLSAGGNNQNYNGAINVAGNSFINLRNNNSATVTDTARQINLLGVVSGSSSITLDSILASPAPATTNQIAGNLLFYNGNSTWTGDLNVNSGTAFFSSFNNVATGLEPFFGYNGIINFNQFGRVIQRQINGGVVNRSAAINFAPGAYGEFQVDNISATLLDFVTVNQNGAVNLNAGSVARFNNADDFSRLNLNGGIVLNGSASITATGGAASVLNINTIGISGTGDLALNNEAGAWGVTSRGIAINVASTFIGNTTLNEGTLIFGHKDALSSGSLTITGASTITPGIDLSGVNAVPNALTQNNNLTVAGTNNLTLSGLYNATGADANRTLTNNLTPGSTLVLSGGVNLGAVGTTAARTWTVQGTGTTEITGNIVDNTAFAHALTKAQDGTLILSGTNTYTGNTNANGGFLGLGSDSAIGGGTLVVGNGGGVFAHGGDRTLANNVTISNNTTTNWQGNHSLTFTGTSILGAAANDIVTNNTIIDGKTLTFTGLSANALTANRTWTLNGTGHTSINGNFTTSSAFGVGVVMNSGTLSLGGTGSSDFNKNNAALTINSGTLRFLADEALSSAAGAGGIVLSPLASASQTARLDLSGTTQTINALTATTTGTVVIDNSSGSAATFRFGANGSAVTVGGGSGSYSFLNTGAGPLSLVKMGSGTASFGDSLILNHAGITASEGGGVFNIAAPLTATTGLRSKDGSTLAILGGLTNPGLITSLEVSGGSTLSLLDGIGSSISNLTSLNLGGAGLGNATLNLNIGNGTTDTLSLLLGGALTLGNMVTFNMTDAGLSGNTTYTLLNIPGGGINAFGFANMVQGATPGGFDSMTWDVTDTFVRITTGNLIVNDLYWRGLTNNTWNGNVNNWSNDKSGIIPATTIPGQGSNVIFAYDTPGTGPLVTTLEQNFKINTLTFEAGIEVPSAVTINPGSLPSARLEVSPQVSTDGINVETGASPVVNLNTALRIGAAQTWTVADAGTVLSIGELQGGANVTKEGAGTVVLRNAAASTFNPGATADFTVNAGVLELRNAGALGTTGGGNLADVVLNNGTVFYYNGVSGNVGNAITMAEGSVLSAGTAAQTYSGLLTLNGAATINLRNNNSSVLTATARNITLGGGLAGTGGLVLDSSDFGVGNQTTGTLFLNQDSSAWTGDITLRRGTINASHPNALGTGSNITFEKGRIQLTSAVGTPTLNQSLVVAASGGDAFAEFELGAGVATTFAGPITLGGPNGTGELQILSSDDAATATINGDILLANNGLIGVGLAATRTLTINSIISETGGSRSLRLNDAKWGGTGGTIVLNGANTHSGGTQLARSNLILGHPSALGTGPFTVDGAANLQATVDLSGANTQANPVTLNGNLTIAGANSMTFGGLFTATGNDASRTLTNNLPATNLLLLTGQVNLGASANTAARTFTVGGTGNTEISGEIINNSGFANILAKTGTGTLILSNTNGIVDGTAGNRYTGGTTITGGTIRSAANHVLPNTGTLTLNIGNAIATLDLNGFNDTIAALTLGGDNGVAGSRHIVTTGTGTLTMGGNLTITTTGNWTNPALIQGNLSVGGANRTFTINNSTGTDVDLRLEAALGSVGAFGFTKEGAGTMLMTAANTYSGITTVNVGELRLHGSISSAGTTTLNNNAVMLLDYSVLNQPGDTKLNAASAVTLAGGTMRMIGSSSVDNFQGIGVLNVNQGASDLLIENGGSQQFTLTSTNIVKGAGGTLDITFSSPSAQFLSSAANGPGNILGFVTIGKSSFATIEAGAVVASTPTNADTLSSWTPLGSFSDTVGYTGTQTGLVNVAGLRFNAAGATSTVTLDSGSVLNVVGGLLVTPNVGAGATTSITGGYLRGGAGAGAELVVHQHNTASDLIINSKIISNSLFTKSGNGTVVLTEANTYSGITYLNEGTLRIAGNTGFGAASQMTFKNSPNIALAIADGITAATGGLSGAGSLGGTTTIGTGATLIASHNGNLTYSGVIAGSGSLIKEGTGTMTLNTLANTLSGAVIVNNGTISLDTNGIGNFSAASAFVLNGGSLRANYNGGNTASNKLNDSASVTLLNTGGINGLFVSSDQNGGSRNEIVNGISLLAGANTFTPSHTGTAPTADRNVTITAASLSRQNSSTMLVRGQNLGTLAVGATGAFIASTRFVVTGGYSANLVGGGSAVAGSPDWSILPWGLADTAIAGLGNSFLTYDTNGFRPLNLTTEFEQLTNSGGITLANNARYSGSADLIFDGVNKTMNSLLVENTGAAAVAVDGFGANLNVGSGAFLLSGAEGITLTGFNQVTTGASNEYVFHVTNTAIGGVTLNAPLTTVGAALTKSSAGRLILAATGSTYTGPTTVNQGSLQIDALNKLGNSGSGGLVLNNGEFVFGGAFDLSAIPVTLGVTATPDVAVSAGGRLNTNGFDVTFANPIGNGGNGGLTKVGAGLLTLNAAANYTGNTSVLAGGLVLGADNAVGSGNLSLAGSTLNIQGHTINVGRFATSGADVQVNGTGTINASLGFGFAHSGSTVINATLTSSNGGLDKSGSDSLTLNKPVTVAGVVNLTGGTMTIMDSLSSDLFNIGASSRLTGTGSITSDVILSGTPGNEGIIEPGSSLIESGVETLSINGGLSLAAGSRVHFFLGQTNFTALEVDTIAYIDSQALFSFDLAPGFIPSAGSSFKVITAGSGPLSGDLDWSDNFFALPGGVTWDLSEFGVIRVAGTTVPISIVNQPAATSVDIGTPATFTVTVQGSEAWLIQWQKKDEFGAFQNINGATGLSFTIPATTVSDAGDYQVVVSNANGNFIETSNVASLTVRTVPVIVAQPQDATRVSTFNHEFIVSVLGPQPYTFVWKKGTDPDNLATFSEIVGGPNSATYLISNLNKAIHAGYYLVEITNSFGTTVSEVVELVINDKVSIAQQPVATSAPEGRTATFTVVAGGDAPPGGFTYQWRNGSTPLTNGSLYQGVNTPTLSVLTQTSTLSSNYNVQITGFNEPSNSVPATSNNVALTLGLPTIGFPTNPVSQMVAVGADLTMSAVTSGALPQTYRWLRSGKTVSGSNVFNATTDTMVILGATVANGGVYALEASNKATNGSDKKTSSPANLVVVDTARKRFVLRQGPTTKSPKLTVAFGGPVTGFQWFETDGVTETQIPGAVTNTFTPPTGLPAGRKMYFCRVSAATTPATLDGGINEILVYNQAPLFNEVNNSPMTPATITVGELFEYQVKMAEVSGSPDATRTPTAFRMTGAPKGLLINSAGLISGRPSVFGAFTITITASNAAGPAVSVVKTLTVLDIDAGLIGNFTGYIDRHPLNSNLGGTVTLTSTKTGSYSVSLIMGTTTFKGKGQLAINTADPQNPTTTVRVSRGRLTPLDVTFRIRASDGTIDYANSFITSTQVAGQANFRGWIDQWVKLKTTINKTPALAYSGFYTAGLNIRDGNSAEIPQGTGYLSFTVNSVTGRLTVSGRLADNTAFTTATVVGPQGQVLVFRTLYASTARGSVQGHFTINPQVTGNLTDNTIDSLSGGVDWLRPFDSSTKARTYKNGFFEDLSVVGSHYVYKTPTDMGINESVLIPNTNAVVSMVEANVNDVNLGKPLVFGPNPELGRVAVHVNSTNKVTVPGAVPAVTNPRTVSATINAKTGLVTIKFTLQQANTVGGTPNPIKRAVTSTAMIIRDGVGNTQALGFFLLPQLPTMTQPNNSLTPILSGQSSLSKP